MAFLDNSGDIILDAVLTETGRRRMAQGNFKIVKFALGDDEIDYSLYNKNHASGSAYYDLEILQTPIFEAFTQINAGINYGLLPTTATDLLYLPTMKVNELSNGINNITNNGGIYYVTDKSGDSAVAVSSDISEALEGQSPAIQFTQGTSTATSFILLETGLDTGASAIPAGTQENRQSYLVANSLVDSRFIAFYDNRFISSIAGLTPDSRYSNGVDSTGVSATNFELKTRQGIRNNISSGLENYSAVQINGIPNRVVDVSGDLQTKYSVINGPRASVLAISPVIKPGLSAEYTLYGTVSSGLLSGATVNYIDTTIYIQGTVSPAQIQIPVRIIRIT